MTTITDQRTIELAANQTAGSRSLIAATAFLILAAQNSVNNPGEAMERYENAHTQGTETQPRFLEMVEADVFSQINRIYDDILQNQVELDADAKRALYTDLWDLYA